MLVRTSTETAAGPRLQPALEYGCGLSKSFIGYTQLTANSDFNKGGMSLRKVYYSFFLMQSCAASVLILTGFIRLQPGGAYQIVHQLAVTDSSSVPLPYLSISSPTSMSTRHFQLCLPRGAATDSFTKVDEFLRGPRQVEIEICDLIAVLAGDIESDGIDPTCVIVEKALVEIGYWVG